MNPITRLLFHEIGTGLAGSGVQVLDHIGNLGSVVEKEAEGRYCFRYVDGDEISGYILIAESGEVSAISLALGIEGDSQGWDGWSEKQEKLRLKKQEEWMEARGLHRLGSRRMKILNSYSPQTGGSQISISFGA